MRKKFEKKLQKNLAVSKNIHNFAPSKTKKTERAGGGTGRRVCLRGISEFYWVQVQVLSGAQKILEVRNEFKDFFLMQLFFYFPKKIVTFAALQSKLTKWTNLKNIAKRKSKLSNGRNIYAADPACTSANLATARRQMTAYTCF